MTEAARTLAGTLLWLRNHYDVGDPKLKKEVLARVDAVLDHSPPAGTQDRERVQEIIGTLATNEPNKFLQWEDGSWRTYYAGFDLTEFALNLLAALPPAPIPERDGMREGNTFNAMIANLIELDKQRTPGPWRKSHEAIGAPGCVDGDPRNLPLVAECDTNFGMYKTLGPLQASKNARFIVALENAWPKLRAALAPPDDSAAVSRAESKSP